MKIVISKNVAKYFKKLSNDKVSRQLIAKMGQLSEEPFPNDSKYLKGKLSGAYRVDSGEYRIVYTVNDEIVNIVLIGKRNDSTVYKIMERIGIS